MTVIAFPNIDETFRLACRELLNEYFQDGGNFLINSQMMQFYKTELHFDIDKVQPAGYPRFCLVGSREADIFEGWCTNALGQKCRVRRFAIKRTAYLSMPRQGPTQVQVGTDTKLISPKWESLQTWWSQFVTVFTTQRAKCVAKGIMNPRLVFSPVQGADKEFLVAIGGFECTAEVSYVWE